MALVKQLLPVAGRNHAFLTIPKLFIAGCKRLQRLDSQLNWFLVGLITVRDQLRYHIDQALLNQVASSRYLGVFHHVCRRLNLVEDEVHLRFVLFWQFLG